MSYLWLTCISIAARRYRPRRVRLPPNADLETLTVQVPLPCLIASAALLVHPPDGTCGLTAGCHNEAACVARAQVSITHPSGAGQVREWRPDGRHPKAQGNNFKRVVHCLMLPHPNFAPAFIWTEKRCAVGLTVQDAQAKQITIQ